MGVGHSKPLAVQMASTLTRERRSSANVYDARRFRRIVFWALAVVAILYFLLSASFVLLVSLGIPGAKGNVLLFSFPLLGLVMLLQFVSGRSVTVGWTVGAALCGALLACMAAPTISHGPLNYFWAARHAFWGAVAGTTGGAGVCIALCRARIRVRHLLELTAACALLMVFWTFYSEASARNEFWNNSSSRSLPTMRVR